MKYKDTSIEYDGKIWSLIQKYYRRCELISGKYKNILLHRYIWEQHNGNIPIGYFIHHKDKNTINNDISNLDLIKKEDHTSLHQRGNKYNLGRIPNDKTRLKMSQARLGKKLPPVKEETKHKISQSLIGHKMSEESRRKMSESRKGKRFSEEHKINLSKSLKKVDRWWLIGRAVSKEQKLKMHIKHLGQSNPMSKTNIERRKNEQKSIQRNK